MGPGDETPSSGRVCGSFRSSRSAGSPACRGWRSGNVRADRTAEEDEYRKTNPTQANLDCHKPYCGIALKSSAASVGSKNEATDRGCSLHAAECLCRDRPARSRGTSGSQARRQELRIGRIKANFTTHGLRLALRQSQTASRQKKGEILSEDRAKRLNRSSRPSARGWGLPYAGSRPVPITGVTVARRPPPT